MSFNKWSIGPLVQLFNFLRVFPNSSVTCIVVLSCVWDSLMLVHIAVARLFLLLHNISLCDYATVHHPFIQSIVDRLPGHVELFVFSQTCYDYSCTCLLVLISFFNIGWKIFIIFCFQFVPCQLSLLFSTFFPFFSFFGFFFFSHSPFSPLLVGKLYTYSVKGNLETSRWYLWK